MLPSALARQKVEVRCEFCAKHYEMDRDEMREELERRMRDKATESVEDEAGGSYT